MGKLKTAVRFAKNGDFPAFAHFTALNLRRTRVWFGAKRHFVHKRPGFPVVCFPEVADSVELYLRDPDDRLELAILRCWLEPGDTFVDVGANIGLYAIAAAHATASGGRVVAIEASPRLADLISRSARYLHLDQLQVREVCAGADAGVGEFFVAPPDAPSGGQSLRVEPARLDRYQRISVTVDTLDHLLGELSHDTAPSCVKVDVEGAEVLVLQGAAGFLSREDAPCWIIEINPAALNRFSVSVVDLLTYFPASRFERWLVPHYPIGVGAVARTSARLLSAGERFDDAVFYNLVALPRAGRWAQRVNRTRTILCH